MRVASIDIGTNTVLLLVAKIDADGTLTPLYHEQRIPRLGKDVDWRGTLSPEAIARVAAVVGAFGEAAKEHGAEIVIASATSAVRDAHNRDAFVRKISAETGIQIEILSGMDEAHWSYRGAISGIPTGVRQFAVVDIGGGSTEIIFPRPGHHNGDSTLSTYSLQIGALRITERHLKHTPPLRDELLSARTLITEELAVIRNPGFGQYEFVGVAGTMTTLACLDQGVKDFSMESVSGYTLPRDAVARWLHHLATLRHDEIRSLSETTAGREDILTAGTLILDTIMELFGLGRIRVSERGLRYGLIIREWERSRSG